MPRGATAGHGNPAITLREPAAASPVKKGQVASKSVRTAGTVTDVRSGAVVPPGSAATTRVETACVVPASKANSATKLVQSAHMEQDANGNVSANTDFATVRPENATAFPATPEASVTKRVLTVALGNTATAPATARTAVFATPPMAVVDVHRESPDSVAKKTARPVSTVPGAL